MIEQAVDSPGKSGIRVSSSGPSRARRLFDGWSASFFQMVLGMTQQVALVPVFLHFWSGETLAAWLVVYSVGYLILITDSGLQFRAINRFLVEPRDFTLRCYGFITGSQRLLWCCCWLARNSSLLLPCLDFRRLQILTLRLL